MSDSLNVKSRERFRKRSRRTSKSTKTSKKNQKKSNAKTQKVIQTPEARQEQYQSVVSPTLKKIGIEEPQYNLIENSEIPQETNDIAPEQIQFDVNIQSLNITDKVRERIDYLERKVQLTPFWKNFLSVFASLSGVFIAIFLGVYSFIIFDELPDNIPIFYSNTEGTWQLYDKSIFLSIPIFVGVVNILLFRFSMMVYNFDHKFVYIVGIIQNIVNLLIVLTVIQILSLVSVIN